MIISHPKNSVSKLEIMAYETPGFINTLKKIQVSNLYSNDKK